MTQPACVASTAEDMTGNGSCSFRTSRKNFIYFMGV
jgi:hypothetical protein